MREKRVEKDGGSEERERGGGEGESQRVDRREEGIVQDGRTSTDQETEG